MVCRRRPHAPFCASGDRNIYPSGFHRFNGHFAHHGRFPCRGICHVRSQLPPTLILSGEQDPLIPPKLIREFQKRMVDAGNRCEFIEYPGAGHGFFNYGRERNQFFQWTMWAFEDFLSGSSGKPGVLE